ncbi:hypothetical protein V7S43_015244 [Phytophthora oleae]|uniref:Uncharacterized protein n=1 Tax=Phytophthora oleae TaxID=2107226 RepID=A0ABD3EZM0_9STRA
MVARILTLLVIDKFVMNSYGNVDDKRIGLLVPVGKFLEVLRVGEMQIFFEEEETPSEAE